MLRPLEVLESVAQIIFDLSEARGVSLYLPAEDGHGSPLLVHHGEAAPVPELADEGAAEGLHRRAVSGSLNGSRNGTQGPLVRVASREEGGLLIGIGGGERLPAAARVALPALGWPAGQPVLWVGLRDAGAALFAGRGDSGGEAEARVLGSLAGLAYCGQLSSAALVDPATRLQGRTAFRSALDRLVGTALRQGAPLSLALVNPRGFGAVNDRLGRAAGDAVLRQIGERLLAAVAGRGLAYRYGAAMFAVVVPGRPAAEAAELAGELVARLREHDYLDGEVRLDFAAGVYALEPGAEERSVADAMLDLVRGADAALVLSGGHDVEVRTGPPPDAGAAARDRLSGIFTAENGRDYRNMLLLWDSVTILASSGDLEALAQRLVEKLCATFELDRVALYLGGDDRPLTLLAARTCGGGDLGHAETGRPGARPAESKAPAPAALELLVKANRSRRLAIAESAAVGGGEPSIRCAVPLVGSDGCRGFLLLESSRRTLRIDASERILLEALGGQLGVAVDRIDRQRRERRRQLQERENLQGELSELRRALHHSKLAYSSPRMEELIEVARRVAPTEATVLILGESGSGKELVARTVHRLSRRGDRPPVVVDCGAIAATLIDRELFGHERGAFTGAERGAPGRLAAADGGTIILDEIGELPLEVQSKLLRFVQEKQVTPVGGTRSQTIDARVIAITHRELASEVAAGRFREDLYHRLNVVRLEVPPLRERPEDVDFLARIFLERFVVQYQKDVRELDPGAERALREHAWPGNVRELQNRVTQAVILCTGPRITAADLGLPAGGYRLPQGTRPQAPAPAPATAPATPAAPPAPAGRRDDVEDAWSALGLALHAQVAAADPEAGRLFPLGRWLADDLVLAAHAAASDVFCHAAARLGLPESTFRRRYRKASAKHSCGLASRAPGWERVRECLADLLREDPPDGSNVLRQARHLLLAEVHERFTLQTAAGAALMGVTEVTYRRWVARTSR